MSLIQKKIVKAYNKTEFEEFVKQHEEREWKKLSEVKEFAYDRYPFQVLMGLEVNR